MELTDSVQDLFKRKDPDQKSESKERRTRNPKAKKAGPEIQRKERIMVAESIPFKYGNKNSTTPQITIKCTDADRIDNKKECLIFADGTQH